MDGQCVPYVHWISDQAAYIYGIWYFVYFFLIPLSIFTYCYGRILAVVRRQARAINVDRGTTLNTWPAVSNVASHRAQVNVIKTLLNVTILFVICWLPNNIYYLLTVIASLWNLQIYLVTIFFAFLSICLNPFIYAGQYNLVKSRLSSWLQKAKRFLRRCTDGKSASFQTSTIATCDSISQAADLRTMNIETVSVTYFCLFIA
jgi:hypothetical protein